MMRKHDREPIEHTCPDIDRMIKRIKQAMVSERDLKSMDKDDLFLSASEMCNELYDCMTFLEEMRKSNNELRMWGIEEATRVDELEIQVDELTDINNLQL